jgi:hypothetical protein
MGNAQWDNRHHSQASPPPGDRAGVSTPTTTFTRAFSAFFGGAAVGAAITGGGTALSAVGTSSLDGQLQVLFLGALFLVFALVIWAVGLLLVGVPAWCVLHALGMRGWRTAVLTGAVLPFGVGLLLINWEEGRPQGLGFPALLGLAGSAVGYTVWRIAYGRSAPA